MSRALVLSAGGMFGAWQAGVWSVLSRLFEPDLVIGASVGSLNGWAIASGCTPERLIADWRQPQVPANAIRQLYRDFQPRIRYALVLTEAPLFRSRVCEWPHVTERHLVASCAVPPILWPQRIDGRWCADGGILTATPIQAAWDLGATEVLALNAMAGYRFGLPNRPAPNHACGQAVVELRPSATLGGTLDMLRWNEPCVRRCIELGAEDARTAAAEEKHFFAHCFERE